MSKFINKLENNTIRKYGFEHRKTIIVFRLTDLMRRMFRIEY